MKRAAIVGFAGSSVLLFAGASAATSASTTAQAKGPWRATKAVLPANAATGENQYVSITAVSCASAGNCSAVGTYQDNSGQTQGLLLTKKAGKWRTGVEAVLPTNAGALDYLPSISCASAGNCAAVGWYDDSSGNGEGLLLTEKAGRWARGLEATLPANAASHQAALVWSVSCGSRGNCSAVGSYFDDSGEAGLLLSEKAGKWRTGVETAAGLSSVSCASAGNCTAVGPGENDSPANPLLVTEKAGTWRHGAQAQLPKGADRGRLVFLTSVSCASAGNCSAVGTYDNDVTDQDTRPNAGVLLTEKGGKWKTGVSAKQPGSLSVIQTDVNSVSCGSAGNCVAVGDYSAAQAFHGMLLIEKAGRWRTAVKPALPTDADPTGNVSLSSVSCESPGSCTAVGTYHDISGKDQGLLVTETAGRWSRGVQAKLPSNADVPAGLATVSCSSARNCTAVGDYGSFGTHGLLLDRHGG